MTTKRQSKPQDDTTDTTDTVYAVRELDGAFPTTGRRGARLSPESVAIRDAILRARDTGKAQVVSGIAKDRKKFARSNAYRLAGSLGVSAMLADLPTGEIAVQVAERRPRAAVTTDDTDTETDD